MFTVFVRIILGRNIYSEEFTCSGCGGPVGAGEGIYLRLIPQPEGEAETTVTLCGKCSQELWEGVIDLEKTVTAKRDLGAIRLGLK
ncbi:hypothetical protein B9Q08_02215 [Candidatus Marsarchaeota G2 archaeon ECH_B_SAG-M15]|uniref:Uncharacterized protein n=1 Tax=Candidatus Marsarchaeota G2 archaeon ECH_B_SAG-M15 TaxID=1978162 RepID=A0A2R6AZF5_9ARCH|nr:MAG: hypothetical protein B9Q08_02215 [Candidatus Marsarchaeota G2 archaeon ECH_B_SAG-M15]